MCMVQVLHPMGWDSFGLPAEQLLIKASMDQLVYKINYNDTMK